MTAAPPATTICIPDRKKGNKKNKEKPHQEVLLIFQQPAYIPWPHLVKREVGNLNISFASLYGRESCCWWWTSGDYSLLWHFISRTSKVSCLISERFHLCWSSFLLLYVVEVRVWPAQPARPGPWYLGWSRPSTSSALSLFFFHLHCWFQFIEFYFWFRFLFLPHITALRSE